MTTSIHIENRPDLLDQHVGIIGKTRSGKSSAARYLVEYLLDQGKPVCIIDPKGDWWGLKSSATGRSAGYPVVIFGGEHADVPLNDHSGAHVAELVATGNRPCIIDLGGWTVGARTRFFIQFAETLFRTTKGHRWLVIDEAHNFAPQGKATAVDPDAGKMLHWANRLASEGAGKGLTLIAASQRPQKVHKDFLTCCETLIAMRLIHPLDRNAAKDWIDGCPDADKGRAVLSSLATMHRGEGWVWSPEIGFGPERVRFPLFRTYDSFKAQVAESAARLKGWASVDLDEVRAKMIDVVEQAKANDPKELRREIADLRRQLAEASKAKPAPAAKTQIVEKPILSEADLKRIVIAGTMVSKAIERASAMLANTVGGVADPLNAILARVTAIQTAASPSREAVKHHFTQPKRADHFPDATKKVDRPAGDGLTIAARSGVGRMLAALLARHPARFTEAQWATMSRLKRTGGTWATYKSRLLTSRLVDLQGDLWGVTQAAIDGYPHLLAESTGNVVDDWKAKLGSGPSRMIDALLEHGGSMTRAALAEHCCLTENAGTFSTYLSRLRSNGLVTVAGDTIELAKILRRLQRAASHQATNVVVCEKCGKTHGDIMDAVVHREILKWVRQ